MAVSDPIFSSLTSCGLSFYIHRFHRSTTRPFFSRERVTDFEIYELHTSEAIQVIASHVERAFDFQELVRRFTLDAAMDFLLGARVHSLRELQLQSGIETRSSEDSELKTFDLSFFTLQHHLAQRSRRVPIWPLFEVKQDITRSASLSSHLFDSSR